MVSLHFARHRRLAKAIGGGYAIVRGDIRITHVAIEGSVTYPVPSGLIPVALLSSFPRCRFGTSSLNHSQMSVG